MPARFALYWAPATADPLHARGSAWLGRDAETGAALPQPRVAGLDLAELTADPRGYGLHATLWPPFRLRVGYPAFRAAAAALAARTTPFDLPPLALTDLDGFLALCTQTPCPPLHALADAAVMALDPCRAPPTEAETARRLRARLTPARAALLARWGYPLVLAEWRFHVTLTRRLTAAEAVLVRPALHDWIDATAAAARRVDHVCIFSQAAPDAPFLAAERLPLGAPENKRTPDPHAGAG